MAKKFLFPFSKVTYNSKVLLVGASRAGADYMEELQITRYADVVGWTDYEESSSSYCGYNLCPLKEAVKLEYDYVLNCNPEYESEEAYGLLCKCGFDSEKLISDNEYYEDCEGYLLENGLFPFEMIPKGCKVALYGAGRVGRLFAEQLKITKYAKLVAVFDENAKSVEWINAYIPEEVTKHEFDYLIVSISDNNSAMSIKCDMIESRVDPDRVIVSNHSLYDSSEFFENSWNWKKYEKDTIGIVNNQWFDNPGSVLSAYALQTFLKRNEPGKNILVLNYTEEQFKYKSNDERFQKRHEKYEDFRNSYLNLSPCFNRLSSSILNLKLYAAICTIDIWRPDLAKRDVSYFYFMRFLHGKAKRIAYAISLASDDVNTFGMYGDLYKRLTDGYKSIFVREKSIRDFFEENSNAEIDEVIDSVFLLDKEEYKEIISNTSVLPAKYIYIYALSPNKQINEFASSIAKTMNLKIVYDLRYPFDEEKYEKVDGIKYIEAGPSEFLAAIKNAEYIITDSFHALSFSLIFQKEFFVFGRNVNGVNISGRALNLLKCVGLEDRFDRKDIGASVINYTAVQAKLDALIDGSKKMLSRALSESDTTDKKISVEENDFCCGCTACASVCPSSAIKMDYDWRGFLVPTVDKDKCTRCGKCKIVCPIENEEKGNTVIRYYAAINSDKTVLNNSSSGGVFFAMAREVLDGEGCVYGVSMVDMSARHIRITNRNDLPLLMGSKYIQSNVGNTYTQVKNDLESGKTVLFSGTPCQVAGLRKFIGKVYENLICIDLICHGVPSYIMFKNNIESIEKKNKIKIVDYKFRKRPSDTTIKKYKKRNQYYYYFEYTDNQESSEIKVEEKPYWNDDYYRNFINCDNYNQVCYICPYAQRDRIGDITIGDYHWAVEHHADIRQINAERSYSISCVSVNTEKGFSLIERTKNDVQYFESKYEWIIERNFNLYMPSCQHNY